MVRRTLALTYSESIWTGIDALYEARISSQPASFSEISAESSCFLAYRQVMLENE